MEVRENKLFINGVSAEGLASEYGTPLYVYDADRIKDKIHEFKEALQGIEKLEIYYACKANSNKHILKLYLEEGIFLDAVSPEEVELGLLIGYKPEQIMMTGSNLKKEEMRYIFENKVSINLDSLSQMETFGQMIKETGYQEKVSVSIRINPNVGGGHHPHTITGGPNSKFGIYYDKIEEAQKIAHKYNLMIDRVHSHIGSGILDVELFLLAFNMVLETAEKIPGLKKIDFGGGFGVKYHPEDHPLELKLLGNEVASVWKEFCTDYGSTPVLAFEPGRILIAEAGYLLAEVTSFNKTPLYEFVGIDTGFNHLLRPILYGSNHPIYNASNFNGNGNMKSVIIAGNICESGDIFTLKNHAPDPRALPVFSLNDIVVIGHAGAYGYSMASNYNLRGRPKEILIKNGKSQLIRKKETLSDMIMEQEL